jgi:hypothetical protein
VVVNASHGPKMADFRDESDKKVKAVNAGGGSKSARRKSGGLR